MALMNKRIIDLPERATLNDDDYVAIDGDTGGTAKYNLSDVVDNVTDNSTELTGIREGADGTTYPTAGDAVRGQISGLKEDLNAIATVEAEQTEIVLNKSDLDTSYDSTYVNVGYIGDNGKFTANSSYRTYYYQATENLSVYLERAGELNPLSLAVYNTSISISNFVGRYRTNDSNLPTKENRLSITAGQWVAISIYSSHAAADFNFGTGLYESGTVVVTPTDEFVDALNKLIEIPVGFIGRATKTATSLTVVIGGKIKYEVNKYSNSTIRAYLWRTNACYVLDANNAWQTVWKDSDSDGVVKISGENDFIGGYHGDETQTLFKLFVDGIEYADTDTFEDVKFNEITIFAYSDVYHCNTSGTPDVVAFKRSKIIKFNKDGYTVENKWTAQEALTLEIAYIGMLSVQKALIQAYTNNSDYYCYTSLNGTNRLSDMTEAEFVLPYGTIGIAVSNYTQPTTYSGAISAYTERLKAYLSTINSSSHGAIANGGVIRGKAVTYFRG